MLVAALTKKIEIVSDSHFEYFILPRKIDDRHVIYQGKKMKSGTSYPAKHFKRTIALAKACLSKGIDTLIVRYERDGSTVIWYEMDN